MKTFHYVIRPKCYKTTSTIIKSMLYDMKSYLVLTLYLELLSSVWSLVLSMISDLVHDNNACPLSKIIFLLE